MVKLPPDALTLREAAEEAGLSPSTLRVLISNNRLKATKMGRDWIVTRRALRTYLASRAPQGGRGKRGKG